MRPIFLVFPLIMGDVCFFISCRNPLTSLHDFQSEIILQGFSRMASGNAPPVQAVLEQSLNDCKFNWFKVESTGQAPEHELRYRVSLWESGPVSRDLYLFLIPGNSGKDPRLELSAYNLPYNLLRYANRCHYKLVKSLEQRFKGQGLVEVKARILEGKADPVIPPGTQVW